MERRDLTPEEVRVIVYKGTERPFSGRFWNHHEAGTYLCRRCGAPLFRSEAKFDSGTGWPSFDEACPGAVREVPDADGERVEIVCARCEAHLGHVFRGEGFTPKDTRYCVNSVSLDFVGGPAREERSGSEASSSPSPAAGSLTREAPVSTLSEEAFFAGGCFWGVEYWFDQHPGVLFAESGYMGGSKDYPTYEDVCTGRTGHAETVRVVFDPTRTSYEEMARLFFEIHDPTQVNRQGPDVGEQYRSVVFYRDEEQRAVAERLIAALKARGLRVATRLEPAGRFWRAEEYHQDYYRKTGKQPLCHTRVERFGR